MAPAALDNRTPYHAQLLFAADENGFPLAYVIVKATFDLSARGNPRLAEQQRPILMAGEFYGDPASSSYKYEPEIAFVKSVTDVTLIGHAYPRQAGDTQVDVTFSVGSVRKTVRVFGRRLWVRRLGFVDMTAAEPLDQVPLCYERAFGGWDSATPDPLTSRFESRNPVGVGFKRREFAEDMLLPNLEDPRKLLQQYGDTPPPAGFGFISPHWQPRAKLAGTYDDAWQQQRAPLLAKDFDRRFFNAASPELMTREYLLGNEEVSLENATPQGHLSFKLPGVRPPLMRVQLRGRPDEVLPAHLDSVIVNADEQLLFLLWRSHVILREGPHDVISADVTS